MTITNNLNLVGLKFNRLTVIRKIGKDKHGSYTWLCRCDCGREKIINGSSVKRGHTKSCGCLMLEKSRELASKYFDKTTHGMSQNNRFYRIWSQMKARCNIPSHKSFDVYGGAGIGYENYWDDFESFKKDMFDSYIKHSKKHGESKTTLDRIDNTKGYSKSNCRWATPRKQANNRKDVKFYEYKGERHTMSELAEKYGIKYVTLKHRITIAKWPLNKAIETPVKRIR